MGARGDCMSCKRIGICKETSLQKVLDSYTCPAYEPTDQEEYEARITVMGIFGERAAIQAMLLSTSPMNGEEEG